MRGGKLSYDELLRERNILELKLKELRRAMEETGKHTVFYQAMQWVSMPLKRRQELEVAEILQEKLRYEEYKKLSDGSRRYEEIHETSILPEFNYLLVRYETDEQGNQTSSVNVWGLIPF